MSTITIMKHTKKIVAKSGSIYQAHENIDVQQDQNMSLMSQSNR